MLSNLHQLNRAVARYSHPLAIFASTLGGLLALLYARRHGPGLMGDTEWYLEMAAAITGEPGAGFDFVRPPGYPLLIALVAMVAGHGNLEALAYLHCLFLSLTAYGTYRIVTCLAADQKLTALAAATLVAFNATAVQNALIILTEPLVMVLTVAFALTLVRFVSWLNRPAARASLLSHETLQLAVVGAGLLLVRVDLVAMVLPGIALVLVTQGARISWPGCKSVGSVLLLIVAFCLPVSLWQTLQAGRLTVLASGATTDESHRGFARWVTTLPVAEAEWKRMVYADTAAVAELPEGVFDDDDERARTERLLHRLDTQGTSPTLEEEWVELAAERIRRDPIGYFVGLPLRRSIGFWFFKPEVGSEQPIVRLVLSGYYWIYTVLFAIGALGVLWFALRPRHPLFVLAWMVLLRTYSILGAGVMTGVGLYEQRYVRCTQPLVLLIAAWVLLVAVKKLGTLVRSRSST